MNFDTKEVLKALCLADGVSGNETEACAVAAKLLSRYSGRVEQDAYGNCYAVIAEPKEGQKTVLLEAHIDEIGMVVTHLEENGFVRVANCGGIDRRLLLAQQVVLHGREKIVGIIAAKPPHLESDEERKQVPSLDSIAIDTGLSAQQAKALIAPGDKVSFRSPFRELKNNRVSAKAVDDRAGVAAVLYALALLNGKTLPCGLSVLFSSQEELGERGAAIGGYRLAPDRSLSVDVSFGETPDAEAHKCGKLGQGPMIGISPSLNKSVSDGLIAAAEREKIPYQLEVMGGETSTDADTIGTMRGGIETGLVSIPIRYMHTPVETVEMGDIEQTGRLLAAYLMGEGADV